MDGTSAGASSATRESLGGAGGQSHRGPGAGDHTSGAGVKSQLPGEGKGASRDNCGSGQLVIVVITSS